VPLGVIVVSIGRPFRAAKPVWAGHESRVVCVPAACDADSSPTSTWATGRRWLLLLVRGNMAQPVSAGIGQIGAGSPVAVVVLHSQTVRALPNIRPLGG
jgi:hypothetical protein